MSKEAQDPKEVQDGFRAGLEADEDLAEAFLFEVAGDMIVGILEGYSEGYDNTYRQGTYPIALVRDEDTGEVRSIHCFYDSLISQFNKERPTKGMRVAVKYQGDKKNREGTFEYKRFVVKVERPEDFVPDFEKYQGDNEA